MASSRFVLLLRGCVLAAALAWLGAPTIARADDESCLSRRVGEILSVSLAEHRFDGALAPGWTLQDVSVAGDHIDLSVLDEHGHRRGIALRLRGPTEGTIDGRGRWFAFVVDAAAFRSTMLGGAECSSLRRASTRPSPKQKPVAFAESVN